VIDSLKNGNWLFELRLCRDRFPPTGDLGYRRIRGAVGLGYRFTVKFKAKELTGFIQSQIKLLGTKTSHVGGGHSAGLGVANALVRAMRKHGLATAAAYERIWLLDAEVRAPFTAVEKVANRTDNHMRD
jgi:hypothetical protein